MKQLRMLCALGLALALTLAAADVTGSWTGQMPTRGGDMTDVTFKLKQDGNSLSGSMNAFDNEIAFKEGKVEGDKISFTVNVEFNGNAFKILFNGTQKGNTLDMSREREGSGTKQKFTLKRAS